MAEAAQPPTPWRENLANRLVGLQVVTAFVGSVASALPASTGAYGWLPALLAFGITGLLALARYAPGTGYRAKVATSLSAVLLAAGISMGYTGFGGITFAFLALALIFGQALGGPKTRRGVVVLVAAIIGIPATLALLGLWDFTSLDSRLIEDWVTASLLIIPNLAVGLMVVLHVISQLERESQALTEAASILREDLQLRDEAQIRLQEVTTELDSKVAERSGRLQLLASETRSLCQYGMRGFDEPLRAIRDRVAPLVQIAENVPETADLVRRIFTRANEMEGIVASFANLAADDFEMGARRRMDVSAMAQAVAEQLRDAYPRAPLEWRIEPNITVDGDPGLVESVLRNLMDNAHKYAAAGRFAEVKALANGFQVRDHGGGFAAEDADRIFGSFSQGSSLASTSGHGVGLATVRRVAERHGGRAWATSDGGARFSVTFGDEASVPEEPPQRPTPWPSPLPSWREDCLRSFQRWLCLLMLVVLVLGTSILMRPEQQSVAGFYWAAWLGFVAMTFWQRPSFMTRGIVAGGILTAVACISWLRTADFSSPTGITICVLTFSALLFGFRGVVACSHPIAVSIGLGFNAIASGFTTPTFDPVTWFEYWVVNGAVFLLGAATTWLVLGRSLALIVNHQDLTREYLTSAQAELRVRDEALARAESLRGTLDRRVVEREEQLRRAIEAQSSLTHTVGHDLRAPIRAVMGVIMILREDFAEVLSPAQMAQLDALQRAMSDVRVTTEAILELAKALQRAAEPQPIALPSLIGDHASIRAVSPDLVILPEPQLRLLLKSLAQAGEAVEVEFEGNRVQVTGLPASTEANILDLRRPSSGELPAGFDFPALSIALLTRRMGLRVEFAGTSC